jgi:hypothetical protein
MVRELGNRPNRARLRPQGRGNEVRVRVDTEPVPPCGFIAAAVDLAMVNTAERHRELVAYFATECTRLRKPKMIGIRGLTPTDEAGLRGDELTMFFVAVASRFADRKHAFVDAATDATARVVFELARGFSRIVGGRADRIAIDAAGADLGSPAPFDGVVETDHDRAAGRHQGFYQQNQQLARYGPGRPRRPIEDTVKGTKVGIAFAPQDAQRRRDGSLCSKALMRLSKTIRCSASRAADEPVQTDLQQLRRRDGL